MIDGHEPKERLKQVKRCIPDLFDYKTLLYVGGHGKFGRNLQLCDEFLDSGYSIDVLEIYRPNVIEMANKFKWISNLWHGDIRTFPSDDYDVIMFWHGPEHLTKEETTNVINRLQGKYKRLVFATPWGKSPQGAMYENPNEVHVSTWYEQDFMDLGMNVNAIGQKDVKLKNNLLAWI